MKTNYLQIIGSIIYGYTHCRLDLAFPVNMFTRIIHSLAEQHYNLLRKLLYYINGTKNWTLNFYRDYTVTYGMDFVFFCNVDAAHADDEELTVPLEVGFSFYEKGKEQSLPSLVKRKTYLYPQQNQKLSGVAVQQCRAHSWNNF